MSGSYFAPAQVSAPGQVIQAQPMPGVAPSSVSMPQMQNPGAGITPLLSLYMQQQREKKLGGGGSGSDPSLLSQAGSWLNQHLFGGPSPGNSAAPLMPVQQQALPDMTASMAPDLTQSALTNALTMGAVPMVAGV